MEPKYGPLYGPPICTPNMDPQIGPQYGPEIIWEDNFMGKSWGIHGLAIGTTISSGTHEEIMGKSWGMPLGRQFHGGNHGESMGESMGNLWGIHLECLWDDKFVHRARLPF
jgi:hypothetical protein